MRNWCSVGLVSVENPTTRVVQQATTNARSMRCHAGWYPSGPFLRLSSIGKEEGKRSRSPRSRNFKRRLSTARSTVRLLRVYGLAQIIFITSTFPEHRTQCLRRTVFISRCKCPCLALCMLGKRFHDFSYRSPQDKYILLKLIRPSLCPART